MEILVGLLGLALMCSPLLVRLFASLTGNRAARKLANGYDSAEVFRRDLEWDKARWFARHNWEEHN